MCGLRSTGVCAVRSEALTTSHPTHWLTHSLACLPLALPPSSPTLQAVGFGQDLDLLHGNGKMLLEDFWSTLAKYGHGRDTTGVATSNSKPGHILDNSLSKLKQLKKQQASEGPTGTAMWATPSTSSKSTSSSSSSTSSTAPTAPKDPKNPKNPRAAKAKPPKLQKGALKGGGQGRASKESSREVSKDRDEPALLPSDLRGDIDHSHRAMTTSATGAEEGGEEEAKGVPAAPATNSDAGGDRGGFSWRSSCCHAYGLDEEPLILPGASTDEGEDYRAEKKGGTKEGTWLSLDDDVALDDGGEREANEVGGEGGQGGLPLLGVRGVSTDGRSPGPHPPSAPPPASAPNTPHRSKDPSMVMRSGTGKFPPSPSAPTTPAGNGAARKSAALTAGRIGDRARANPGEAKSGGRALRSTPIAPRPHRDYFVASLDGSASPSPSMQGETPLMRRRREDGPIRESGRARAQAGSEVDLDEEMPSWWSGPAVQREAGSQRGAEQQEQQRPATASIRSRIVPFQRKRAASNEDVVGSIGEEQPGAGSALPARGPRRPRPETADDVRGAPMMEALGEVDEEEEWRRSQSKQRD